MSAEPNPGEALSDFALDSSRQGLGSMLRDFRTRMKTGDLGSLPAILAIVVLVAVFGIARPDSFLSALNLANFLEQAAAVIVIAMAVTFVLLLGEIDLAAGYTAGVAAAVLALRLQDDWPLLLCVALSAAVAIALGLWTGTLVAKLGIPSFVVTLANFLIFQGILQLLVKEGGSVRIENGIVKDIVGGALSPTLSWVVAIAGVGLYSVSQLSRRRRSDGTILVSLVAARIVGVTVLVVIGVVVLNKNRAFATADNEIRGMPYVVPLVLILMLLLSFVLKDRKSVV